MPKIIDTLVEAARRIVPGANDTATRPATDDDVIAKEIDEQVKRDEDYRKRWEIEAYVNRSFLDGDHYVKYSRSDSSLVSLPVARGEKRRTINFVRVKKRGVMALIFRNDPKIHVRGGDTDATAEEIKVAYYFLKKLWKDWNVGQLVRNVCSMGLDNGVGYLMYDYDETIPEKGNIRFWIEDPLACFCDAPMSGDPQDCTYFIRTFSRPISALANDPLYSDKAEEIRKLKPDNRKAVSEMLNTFQENKFYTAVHPKDFTSAVMVKERQIKEWADGKPQIRVTVKAGDKVIRNEVLKGRKKYNVLAYRPEEQPGVWYSRAWMSDLIDPQRSINTCFSSVEAWIEYSYKVKMLAKQGQKFSFRNDSNGQVIRYTGNQAPVFQQPPALPQSVFQHLDMAIRFVEAQTIHSESQGRTSGSASSGVAIAQLQAANVNNVNDPIQNLKIFLEDLFAEILDFASENYNTVRKLVFEENGEKAEYEIIGEKAAGKNPQAVKLRSFKHIEVEIIPGDAFSDLQARSDAKELFDAGIIGKEAVLDTYRMGNTRELLDRAEKERENAGMNNPDIKIAEAENIKMSEGKNVQPQPGEDHKAHLAIHSAFLDAVIKSGNEEVKAILIEHLKATEAIIQFENQPMSPQPLGSPAPAVPAMGGTRMSVAGA